MNPRIFAAFVLAANVIGAPSLLVLNKEDATLSIIDPASRKTVATIPTGEGPHEIAVSKDARFAYVSNYGSGRAPGNSISIIDLTKREGRIFDITPLQRAHGIEVGSDGKVYFTAEANKLVARYDPAANRMDWMIGTGQNATHMVMLTKDMNRIITANIASDTMTIMDRAGAAGWNGTVVAVGKGPEGFDLSPDGRELWVGNSRGGSISIVDIGSKQVTKTVDVQTKRSNRVKFSPDGKLVLVSDLESGDVVVVDASTRQVRKRTKLGTAPEGILMHPDGSRAYIAVSGDNRIDVMDLKTLEIVDHIQTGRGPDGMAWVDIAH